MLVVYLHPIRKPEFQPRKKPAKVENNPVLQFFYPKHDIWEGDTLRTVKLIKADHRKITGLEVMTDEKGRTRHALKSFLHHKMKDCRVIRFGDSVAA